MKRNDAIPEGGKNGHYIIKKLRGNGRGGMESYYTNDCYYEGGWIITGVIGGGDIVEVVKSCVEMNQAEIDREIKRLNEAC